MTEHTDTPDPTDPCICDPAGGDKCSCAGRVPLAECPCYGYKVRRRAAEVAAEVAAVTPPVAGETTEAAVLDVAEAIHRAFQASSTDGWDHEARAAIAAYLPHLTAERDAETTRAVATVRDLMTALGLDPDTVEETDDAIRQATALRAENEQLRRITAEVSRLRWLTDEHGPVVHALGEIELLASKVDGDTPRPLDSEKADRVYRLAGDAIAVLADPAPSTPAAQENQL